MAAFAINEQFPIGQKTIALVLSYMEEIEEKSLSIDTYKVKGRTVIDIRTAKQICGQSGYFVVISLDSNDKKALTRKMKGMGAATRTVVIGAKIIYRQVKSIMTVSGHVIEAKLRKQKVEKEISPVIDDFVLHTFHTADGRELCYNLYKPKNDTKIGKMPLVLFMHDSSACSDSPVAPLIQGMGAYIWASPEEQAKRPCYVLVPSYPGKTASDKFEVTWECEATVELVGELVKKENIDPGRIYGTGQSMGSMMLCELNIKHPELFAASYIVAGQWSPQRLTSIKNKNIWIMISEKDEKAYPIMTEAMNMIEESGGKVATGNIDAKASCEEKKKFAEEVLSQKADIQFTYYIGKSVLADGVKEFPGCFHLSTWQWAYDVEPIREWIFTKQISFKK